MTQTKRIAVVFALCFVAGVLLKVYQDRRLGPAELRRAMVSSARSGCLDRAHQAGAGRGRTPLQVNRYCDCVTRKAIDPLSDAELRDAAGRGANPSAEDVRRIRGIAQVCTAEVYGVR